MWQGENYEDSKFFPRFQCSAHLYLRGRSRFFLRVKDRQFKFQVNVQDGVFTNRPLFERTVGVSRRMWWYEEYLWFVWPSQVSSNESWLMKSWFAIFGNRLSTSCRWHLALVFVRDRLPQWADSAFVWLDYKSWTYSIKIAAPQQKFVLPLRIDLFSPSRLQLLLPRSPNLTFLSAIKINYK